MQSVYSSFEIAPGVTAIEEGGVRMFLVEGTHRAMLVDTGFGGGDLAAYVATLTDKPVFVLNTHADGDHVSANHQFEHVLMHPSEMHRYYETCAKKEITPAEPAAVYEGLDIDLGSSRWEVLPIPGHTPGSIALFERSMGLLIGGDTIQFGPIFMFGPGRNLPAFIQTLTELYRKNLPISRILPSHNSIELPADIMRKVIDAAIALQKGELTAQEPTRPLPCKLYTHENGISFFY